MIVAGSDTSARTLEQSMSLLMNHPEILEKAKIEIDIHVDHNRLVDDSDLPNLTYIHWIINETLRLFPLTPLLLPHYSSQDCTIGGCHVPKGTILFVNAWALHRDPTLWEEPTKFKPERFEKERDQGSFKYMPFGVGRRSCPGNHLALRNVTLALAALIQCFNCEMDESDQRMVDLTEGEGPVVMHKDKPLHAMCRPRSSMKDVLQSVNSNVVFD